MKNLKSFPLHHHFFGLICQSFRPLVPLAFATVSLLASCDKDKDKNEPTPAQGSFFGAVDVQDEVGQPVAAKSGVTVTLEGGPTPISTTTDADGNFHFKNLPWGTYTAVYKRGDVGTWQEQNLLLHAQDRTLTRRVKLGQLASTTVTSFSLSGSGFSNSQPFTVGVNYNRTLYHNRPLYPDGYSYRTYLSTTADVSNTNYGHTMVAYDNQNPGGLWWSYDELKTEGFKSGDRVYVVAYGAPGEEVSYLYTDPTNGVKREIVTNLNPVPSPVLSFVLP